MLAKLVVLGTSTFFGLQAHAADVDVAVVFAVDVSASIDPATADLQREGHAEAICSPEVIAAIIRNHIGCVGITYFEWSSHGYLRIVLPWTRVCGLGDGKAAASVILERGRIGNGHGGTSISFAVDEGSLLLDQFPGKAARKVIDIAANGTNNDGMPVQQSRLQAIAKGYTINAVAVSTTDAWRKIRPHQLFRRECHRRSASFRHHPGHQKRLRHRSPPETGGRDKPGHTQPKPDRSSRPADEQQELGVSGNSVCVEG